MITGFFSDLGRPYISSNVTLPQFDVSTDVYFLLDTGSDSSCLHLVDALNLTVPESSLGNESFLGGIGGTAIYYREPAIVTFEYGSIHTVSYNIDLDLSYSYETVGFPSLLGRDILDDWHIEYSRKRNLLRCAI